MCLLNRVEQQQVRHGMLWNLGKRRTFSRKPQGNHNRWEALDVPGSGYAGSAYIDPFHRPRYLPCLN
jgi:hypothetical protein